MSPTRVILPGASSQIGVFAIPRLLAAGFRVSPLSRRPKPDWYPEFDGVHWAQSGVPPPMPAGEAVMMISAAPIGVAVHMVNACRGMERAVVFSTTSVYSKRDSRDPEERRLMEEIILDEARLADACAARGVALSIFRPTLVYGCGLDRNVSRLARWIERFGVMPLAGDAGGLRQPVHADDLAGAAVAALTRAGPLALDTPLCGGSTLSYRDMIGKIAAGIGRPARTIGVPAGILAAVAALGRMVPGIGGVRPEMVRRQAVDLVFDDSRARWELDYDPRPFEPVREDFDLPDVSLLQRLAGLNGP